MGHRTIQMTMRYAHLAPEHNQGAIEKAGIAVGRVATQLAATDSVAMIKRL